MLEHAWRLLWLHYHKDWVDVGTFIVAGLWGAFRWVKGGCKARLQRVGRWRWHRARCRSASTTIFPLLVLSGSVLSRQALVALENASRVTLAIAGLFALLSVLQIDEET